MKLLLVALLIASSLASAQTLNYADISAAEKTILQPKLEEILRLLPQKMRSGLPPIINIKLSDFGTASSIPANVCDGKESSFKYGQYRKIDKSLTLNRALISEFSKGKNLSSKISCQHGSLYDQAVSTVVHELGHAFDSNNGSPSSDKDFANIAGFKKSLVITTKKNDSPMRSPDEYEFKNIEESFAVNLEYFVMDEEFACRRPVMHTYYKKLFGSDPHSSRSCEVNRTLMVTTQMGMLPVSVDPSRVYRIDYLMAAPGSDMSSGFGHSMYRLVICAPDHTDPITGKNIAGTKLGEKCLKDKLFHLVVSYRANNQNATLNYFKGIFGGYPSMLFILGFGDVLEEYNRTELRDLTSYPLKLSDKEKIEFMNRISEEHWGYRGSYKFVTTNCATESLRIIKNNLVERREEKGIAPRILPTLTPVGLRHLLETSGMIDQKDPAIENYPAKLDALMVAYSLAYEHKSGKTKANNKAISKFILESTPDFRMTKFHAAVSASVEGNTRKEQLLAEKGLVVKLASFSLLEQQVIRAKIGLLKKKLAEMTSDEKLIKANPQLAALRSAEKNRGGIETTSSKGYGIPTQSETLTTQQVEASMNNLENKLLESDDFLRKLFAAETEEILALSQNLKEMNAKSLALRLSFKNHLDQYIGDELRKHQGSKMFETEDVAAIRHTLGAELVTEKEIANDKFLKLIRGEG